MPQKHLLLLLEFDQPPPQPVETIAKIPQVRRTTDADTAPEFAGAELSNGLVELPDRPRHQDRRRHGDQQPDGYGREKLPPEYALRAFARSPQALDFTVDQPVAQVLDVFRQIGERDIPFDEGRL